MQLGKVTGPLQCQLAQKHQEHLKFINPFFFSPQKRCKSLKKKNIRDKRAVLCILGTITSWGQRHLPATKKYCHFHFHGFLLPFTFWYWPHSQPSPESLNSVPGSCNVLVYKGLLAPLNVCIRSRNIWTVTSIPITRGNWKLYFPWKFKICMWKVKSFWCLSILFQQDIKVFCRVNILFQRGRGGRVYC